MSTETKTAVRTDTATSPWRSATVASLFAGVAMGLVIHYTMPFTMGLIGDMYGSLGPITGWTAHLFHSLVFGLLYAGVVGTTSLSRYGDEAATGGVLGAAYGVVVWAVAAAYVMPIWLSRVMMQPPAVPNFDVTSLFAHLVFGVLLGVTYAIIRNR